MIGAPGVTDEMVIDFVKDKITARLPGTATAADRELRKLVEKYQMHR